MTILWPGFLLGLVLIPLLIGLYIWMQRRRRKFAVRYSSLSLLRGVLPRRSRVRRHIPFALFLLALTSLLIAMARPVNIIDVPTSRTVIILALDVSGSMRSADIRPTRLLAAEKAAMSFIQRQKAGTQIGIVAFSTFAELVQPPTNDREMLQTTIESLITGRRTAIGSGILKSLDAISEVDKSVSPSTGQNSSSANLAPAPTPVPKGLYAPDIIVLLTDGVSNTGPVPVEAAQQAADRGVRVYTIGFGTDHGFVPFTGSGSQSNQQFGQFRTGIDENAMKQIADMTGGEYYQATSADELLKVFESLPTNLIMKHETQEVSVLFAGAGALFAILAFSLAMLWHPLP